MSVEEKLNKAIQQDGVNTQSHILDKLKRRYPQYVEQLTDGDVSHKKGVDLWKTRALKLLPRNMV